MGTKDSRQRSICQIIRGLVKSAIMYCLTEEKVIKPENLKECDTTEVLSVSVLIRSRLLSRNGEIC